VFGYVDLKRRECVSHWGVGAMRNPGDEVSVREVKAAVEVGFGE
jgi:hypothetical protein